MHEFLSLIISGAVGGALYAILASGLVLTYQTSGILNFAHGAVAFATAYLFYVLHQPTATGGLGLPVALVAVISVAVFAPLLGWFLDRVMLRKLATTPEAVRIVGTIGLLVAMPALVIFVIERLNSIFGLGLPGNSQAYSPPGLGPRPTLTWSITRGVAVTSDQLAVLAAAAAAAVGLWLVLRHTRLGLETRAGVDRKGLAQMRGIDTDQVGAVSWVLSFVLAGLAGVLIAPLFDLEPLTYDLLVFAAFTAVVFAGLRSIPLAFAGGLLLGVVQNLVYGYAPSALANISGFRSVAPFALLLLLLLAIGGHGGIRAATSAETEGPSPDPRQGLPALRRRLPWAVASVALAVYVLFAAGDFWVSLIAEGLALGLVFLSFVVVTGLGGMISLAQATFTTAGAFTAGWLLNHQFSRTVPVVMSHGHVVFVGAVVAAAAVAAVAGVLVALTSLRLGGLALALATLALAFIGGQLVFQIHGVSHGSGGWSVVAPKFAGIDFSDPRPMAILLLLLCFLLAAGITNLVRSSSGRAMLAVRSTDLAARAAGISPVRTKLGLFAVSAAIAGFGGAMYAAVASPFTNTTAPAIQGVIWLAVTVTFGVRRAAGAVLAGLAVATLPSGIVWLRSSTFSWTVLFALAVGVAVGCVAWLGLKPAGRARLHGQQVANTLLAIATAALIVAAGTKSDALLYAALVAGGLVVGMTAGAGLAARPTTGAAVGTALLIGLLAAPQVISWVAGAHTASTWVSDVIGSSQFPPILFGLGAIGLAANPDGVLAAGGELFRNRRESLGSPTAASVTASPRTAARPAVPVPVAVEPSASPVDAADPPAALRIEGLCAGWGDVEVLHGVDLEVTSGTVLALIGANGAGKSTLCSAVGGLTRARAGRVLLEGVDVTGAPIFRRARAGLFLVPEARGIFPGLAVEENLALWLRTPSERDRAYERFPILAQRRKHAAGLLSGGEQQMLALASALERPPKVLVADEPTLGLAPRAVEDVFRTFSELRSRGVALLLVEEKARGVLDVADTVALMRLGRIRWTGPRLEADAERLATAYLGI